MFNKADISLSHVLTVQQDHIFKCIQCWNGFLGLRLQLPPLQLSHMCCKTEVDDFHTFSTWPIQLSEATERARYESQVFHRVFQCQGLKLENLTDFQCLPVSSSPWILSKAAETERQLSTFKNSAATTYID